MTNIVLIVWDACRLEAAREHAPTLRNLAEENLWFENAVAPAGESLGSHVSMFSGQYPHEHGVYEQTDTIKSPLPLVRHLEEQGYDRYGVSANGFAAPKFGFDRGFDEFYNTQGLTVFPKGLDVHRYAREVRDRTGGEFSVEEVRYSDLISQVLKHEHSVKSFANVAAAGLSELTNAYPGLRQLPHPRFNKYNEFCYSPEQNTELITDIFERVAETDRPFFLFTNYMDTHHPYTPNKRLQREVCGRTFSYGELQNIAHRSHPLEYLESVSSGNEPTGEELETIRNLYQGEVQNVDKHLSRVLTALEANGLREETLIIVTADHGENLGERNKMGEKHMGHICSASDHHLQVPLVIAHPEIEDDRIEEFVSTKNLRHLLVDGREALVRHGSEGLDELRDEDPVASEVTSSGNDALIERRPELQHVLERDLVASYLGDWKVVMGSDGETFAWENGEPRSPEDAPLAAVETCQDHMASLEDGGSDRELSESEASHLEALGYL